MRLGYPVRLARYAFLLGLIALALSGITVFSLNVVTARTENFQTQLSGRLKTTETPEVSEEPEGTTTPEYTPVRTTKQINQLAARRTALMLRPMVYYLLGTGALWGLTSWRKLS